MIRFLHLSDIHFTSWLSGQPHVDLELAVRERMLCDISLMCDELGPMSGVLVAGDVAARGSAGEYTVAAEFLEDVTARIGCAPDKVVMVPGNHDVNRNALDVAHEAFRYFLRSIPVEQVSDKLLMLLRHESAQAALLRPFEEYNKFALRFRCDLAPERLVPVVQQFESGQIRVYIHGYNTAWLADGDEDRDGKGLVAGEFQLALLGSPSEGIHIVMCHHPPEWLRDSSQLAPWVAQASIVLTGHEHVAGIALSEDRRTLYVASGAVNPSRTEAGWIPAYNVIEIAENETDRSTLHVTVHTRSWRADDGHAEFGPDSASGSVQYDVVRHLPGVSPPSITAVQPVDEVDHVPESVDDVRHALVFELMDAAPDRRRRAARTLGLLTEPIGGDLDIDRRILDTALERGLLAQLVDSMKGSGV